MRKTVIAGLLASSLIAAAVQAQTPSAAATGSTAANPVAPGAIQALRDMGAYLQSLSRFEVTTEVTGERVLADGQKLQHGATAVMQVARPNRLRAKMTSARSERVLVFNGRTATLYTPAQKVYSSVEVEDTVGGLVTRLQQRYGVEVPLSDLFLWGTPAAPLERIESAMNAGQDFIGGDLCDHYAFRQGSFDWQIWIKAGSQPLPRKLVIVNRADEARPQSVSLIQWNLKPTFGDAVFNFTAPPGTTRAEWVPLKSK
jgi:hypothetical protein